jgi:enoyl-CoA hydratase/carnithine racemase
MADESEAIKYETRDGKCFITINRPEAMNAINIEARRLMALAIDKFSRDPSTYVAILSGEGGRAFSAGGDLKEQASMTAEERRQSNEPAAVPSKGNISDCRKPIIAAIDGYAYALGCEIALQCDIRLATRKSLFAIPEARRSIIAGPGTTHLPRLVPLGEALLMVLTCEPMTAERAYQIGLVQKLCEDREELFVEANKIADSIAQNAPIAVQDSKHIIKVGSNMPIEYAVYLREKYFDAILGTEDAKEGPLAFAERRNPIWKGR